MTPNTDFNVTPLFMILQIYARFRWNLQTREHLFAADSMALSSFASTVYTQRAPEKAIWSGGALRPFKSFKVIEIGTNRKRVYAYFLLFQRYNDLLVEHLRFSRFCPPSLVWSPHKGVSMVPIGYERSYQKPSVAMGYQVTHYQRVTDRWTDRHTTYRDLA